MPDRIHINRLTVSARVGVSDAERARPQRLEISLTFPVPTVSAAAAGDDLSLTVDYFAVGETVKRVAAARPRKLLETLAEEIAAAVLAEFTVSAVTLEVRKFILPETNFVSLVIERRAAPAAVAKTPAAR
ncbi:MAG: dihydroneopterin aldolase [Verrucomicrobiales bacterium]|jgi:dihydroneopterin aldolase|nr:dihydroneopterin aldolase [Verrucomicrobiales bacterium]